MFNLDGTVTLKMEQFLKLFNRAVLFDRICDSAKMVNPFHDGEPWIMFQAETVIKERAPEIFDEINKRCRAEWEQKKKEKEESA